MVAYKNTPLNLEAAHKYVTALGAMIANSAPRELSNPREAALIAVPKDIIDALVRASDRD